MTTAGDVMDALRRGPFRAPAFVLLENVRNGTGFQRQDRYADAIALSLWPSRGVYLSGVEIKVSRSDWRKELDQPTKAAEHQRFCRYWHVAAPPGVVEASEVPETWGYLEVKGKAVRAVKTAPKLDEQAPTLAIMASILRNAGEGIDARVARERAKAVEEAHKELGAEKVAQLERDLRTAEGKLAAAEVRLETVERFEQQAGFRIDTWGLDGTVAEFKAAHQLAQAIGRRRHGDPLAGVEAELRRAMEAVAAARATFAGVDQDGPSAPRRNDR